MTALLWLRRDLRVHDHPALHAALASGDPVVPVFCLDDRLLHGRHRSAPRAQFLLESLQELDSALRERGCGLVVRHGRPEAVLPRLAGETGASAVHATSDAGPFARTRDDHVQRALQIPLHLHPGAFVADLPQQIETQAGAPYTVFSPFHRRWASTPRRRVLPAPERLPPLPPELDRGGVPTLAGLGLGPGVSHPMRGGERAARRRADAFLAGSIEHYRDGHNALAGEGTSRLSPYLHFGCISPRELEERAGGAAAGGRWTSPGHDAWVRQLAWRDFYGHVLLRFPDNTRHEHQERYRATLTWSRDEELFAAWREGATGYPLVDAGMRQLAREGWMHNRARLTVGSFLTKDLAIDWRWGERWFMRMLSDGDEANNNGNWQWIASVGVDPQPAFKRILNPARQQERFDPHGEYVRRYVPELRQVPNKHLSEPWTMGADAQRRASCVIGRDYPEPIVDHAAARRAALARYGAARAQ